MYVIRHDNEGFENVTALRFVLVDCIGKELCIRICLEHASPLVGDDRDEIRV